MSKRIWQVNDVLFCPIAGYCLNPVEQKKLLIKSCEYKIAIKNGTDSHHFIMDALCKETSIALAAEKILEKKYYRQIKDAENITADEWMNNIHKYLSVENFGAYIWISAVHKEFTENQYKIIFRNIHHFSHDLYFKLLQTEKRLILLEGTNQLISEKYKNVRMKQKQTEKELAQCKNEITSLQQNKVQSCESKPQIKPLTGDNETFFQTIKRMQGRIEKQDEIIDRLRERNKQLTRLLEDGNCHFSAMKNEISTLTKQIQEYSEPCQDCDKINLCQKRILLVGGLEKMKKNYEELVSQLGGIFKHHNGECQHKSLDELVRWSDFVLCSVDVNSHDACQKVKRECKANGKKFFMLRKSSVSSVYKALATAVSG